MHGVRPRSHIRKRVVTGIVGFRVYRRLVAVTDGLVGQPDVDVDVRGRGGRGSARHDGAGNG